MRTSPPSSQGSPLPSLSSSRSSPHSPSPPTPNTPLTPSSLHDLTLDASRSHPLPPTGHDLMSYFPPTQRPCITGKLFERQERDYFSRRAAQLSSSSTSRERDRHLHSFPASPTLQPLKKDHGQGTPSSFGGSLRQDLPRNDHHPAISSQARSTQSSPHAYVPSHAHHKSASHEPAHSQIRYSASSASTYGRSLRTDSSRSDRDDRMDDHLVKATAVKC